MRRRRTPVGFEISSTTSSACAAEIAELFGMALSTVSGILQRLGLGRLGRIALEQPPLRYERSRPGELVHVDVKRLGRIEGGAGKRSSSTWQAGTPSGDE